jgi:multiple sugar transport system permease protein
MRLTLERRRWIWAYLFLLVPLAFFLSIRIGPTLYAFWMSFHEWDPIALDRPWIGFNNYRELAVDEVFWKSLRNTWVYVLIGVPAGLIVSLVVALGLQRLIKFVGFYRVLYFLPYITSLVAVGWVWRWMYMPNGLFNDALGSLGLPSSRFLGSPDTAIYSIIAMTVWQALGFQVVIFLAGLESIPGDFIDAAAVDGASSWQRFRDIILPLLNPTIVFLVITGVISNLQVFTQIRAMSSGGTGGPLNSTVSVVLYVYQKAFQSLPSEMGYAASMMVVLFVIILLITIFQLKVLSKGAYDL